MPRPKAPCKDCQDRWTVNGKTCHATCEKYQEYCRLNDEYKASVEHEKIKYCAGQWYKTYNGWWRKK